MGMFDYITCDYPLPGQKVKFLTSDHQFQSKNLNCELNLYHIDSEGQLWLIDRMTTDDTKNNDSEKINITNLIDFYTSNASILAYDLVFTNTGEDYESVNYQAEFVDGKLKSINQSEYTIQKALPVSVFEEIEKQKPQKPNRLLPNDNIGKTFVYVHNAFTAVYKPVIVVAETDKQLCFKTDDNKLITEYKSLYMNSFWDTKEDYENYTQTYNEWKKGIKDKYGIYSR